MTAHTSLILEDISPKQLKPVEILHITDSHLPSNPESKLLGINTEDSFHAVVNMARRQSWPPDLVLMTGDLVQNPSTSIYARLAAFLKTLGAPCCCLPGNHDDPRMLREILQGENIYCGSQILAGNWQIICLDSTTPGSEAGKLSDATLQTLGTLLNQRPTAHALIALHHHSLAIDCAWLDTMVLQNGAHLFSILNQYPQVRGIVCGHIHQRYDTTHKNLRLLGTPSTCFQFKPHSEKFELDEKPAGFRKLRLFPDGQIETQVCRLNHIPKKLDLESTGY